MSGTVTLHKPSAEVVAAYQTIHDAVERLSEGTFLPPLDELPSQAEEALMVLVESEVNPTVIAAALSGLELRVVDTPLVLLTNGK